MLTKLFWKGELSRIFFAEIRTVFIPSDTDDHGKIFGLLTHFAR